MEFSILKLRQCWKKPSYICLKLRTFSGLGSVGTTTRDSAKQTGMDLSPSLEHKVILGNKSLELASAATLAKWQHNHHCW